MPTTKPLTDETVLNKLQKGPQTKHQLGCTRHRLLMLTGAKLIKRAGEAKNPGSGGRKAVVYELTAKGRKRAEKL